PFKTPAGPHSQRLRRAILEVLGLWLRRRAHVVVILPRRADHLHEGRLRTYTLQAMDEVVASNLLDTHDLATGNIKCKPVRKVESLPLKTARVGFRLSRPAFDLDWVAGGPSPIRWESKPTPTVSVEPIATNENGDVVAVTLSLGKAKLSYVPRGMLGGPLEELNWVIPTSLNLEFPWQDGEPTVELERFRVSADGEVLEIELPAQVLVGRKPGRPPKPGVRINGHLLSLSPFELLYLKTLWDRSGTDSPPSRITWPDELGDSQRRDNVRKQLRQKASQLGIELLARGSGTRPPMLAPCVVPKLLTGRGWEQPVKKLRVFDSENRPTAS
ncbi:MAG: hypothetical protein ACF8XB_08870, partial [Planctomycetota bacterium JB042]